MPKQFYVTCGAKVYQKSEVRGVPPKRVGFCNKPRFHKGPHSM